MDFPDWAEPVDLGITEATANGSDAVGLVSNTAEIRETAYRLKFPPCVGTAKTSTTQKSVPDEYIR